MLTEATMTMAVDDDDPVPFTPVTPSKPNKKAKTNPSEVNRIEHVHEIDLRIIFTNSGHSGRTFNVATYTKNLFSAMLHHDETIAIKNDHSVLYLAHDPFPKDEEQFRSYFNIHNPTKHPKQRNQTVIGCVILSNRTIPDIKKAETDKHTMMTWLQDNHTYLEADSLGTTKICTVGYLFNVHPRLSHHTYLKQHIYNELEKVSITNDEAQALDPHAKEYHDDNSNETFIPPFEIYLTSAGHGPTNKRVVTKTIGIKSNIEHAALLKEMLVRTTTNSATNKPTLKFIPTGLASTIGNEAYAALICKNNQYLTSATMIPVIGFTKETLNLYIEAYDPITKTKKKTIRNILLDTPWCHAIEPTNYVGKFHMITTKAFVQEGRQWLDANLKPMFDNYISKLPNFVPDIDNPVAQRADYRPQSTTMSTYAAALKSEVTNATQPSSTNSNKRFTKPPKTYRPQNLAFNLDPKDFPDTLTNRNTTTNNDTTQTTNTNIINTNSEQSTQSSPVTAAIATNHIDIAELQRTIIQTIRGDIQQHIQQQIQKEMSAVHTDLLGIKDLHRKHDDLNDRIANMQSQLSTLINHMSSLTTGGGMK